MLSSACSRRSNLVAAMERLTVRQQLRRHRWGSNYYGNNRRAAERETPDIGSATYCDVELQLSRRRRRLQACFLLVYVGGGVALISGWLPACCC